MNTVSAQKANLRCAMRAHRATQKPTVGTRLKKLVLESELIPPHAIIGGFMPLQGEIDISPLLHELHKRGHTVALPETPPAGQELTFRVWTPDTPLRTGRFGTQHPDTAAIKPDFLLIPLLAFDAHGHRLGYGGGYYDRTIASLPHAFRLGCAYAIQQVETVPTEPTDQTLHAIATEKEIIQPKL